MVTDWGEPTGHSAPQRWARPRPLSSDTQGYRRQRAGLPEGTEWTLNPSSSGTLPSAGHHP